MTDVFQELAALLSIHFIKARVQVLIEWSVHTRLSLPLPPTTIGIIHYEGLIRVQMLIQLLVVPASFEFLCYGLIVMHH